MNYAVVDIETDGGEKITEISVLVFDGEKIIDEFTTLINPNTSIPFYITKLTGIDNSMVRNAPKFEEVAKKIHLITEGCVFVAHNVNFDYRIIGKEFSSLGFSFKRKKLCTVRLSRKLMPNKRSYSLGKLCFSEGIEIKERHRAKGDAEATVILLKKLLKLNIEHHEDVVSSFLNPRSRQATLPPLLPKQVFDGLPKTYGVYYFWNKEKEVIYVGKANNIKQRVLSHFHDKKKKEMEMCLVIANITYQETGSELLALLHESAEIKRLFPKFNRAQRISNSSYGLFSYQDRKGVIHLAWNNLKLIKKPITRFYSVTQARIFVENLCEEFELCPKYCHLQTNVSSCFHYQLKKCKGVCRDNEEINVYNQRVESAIKSISFNSKSFIIKEKGRVNGEIAFVLILDNIYQGYGYLQKERIENFDENSYMENLVPQLDNYDIRKIIFSYLRKNPSKYLEIFK